MLVLIVVIKQAYLKSAFERHQKKAKHALNSALNDVDFAFQ